jgi:hypothetical protein
MSFALVKELAESYILGLYAYIGWRLKSSRVLRSFTPKIIVRKVEDNYQAR